MAKNKHFDDNDRKLDCIAQTPASCWYDLHEGNGTNLGDLAEERARLTDLKTAAFTHPGHEPGAANTNASRHIVADAHAFNPTTHPCINDVFTKDGTINEKKWASIVFSHYRDQGYATLTSEDDLDNLPPGAYIQRDTPRPGSHRLHYLYGNPETGDVDHAQTVTAQVDTHAPTPALLRQALTQPDGTGLTHDLATIQTRLARHELATHLNPSIITPFQEPTTNLAQRPAPNLETNNPTLNQAIAQTPPLYGDTPEMRTNRIHTTYAHLTGQPEPPLSPDERTWLQAGANTALDTYADHCDYAYDSDEDGQAIDHLYTTINQDPPPTRAQIKTALDTTYTHYANYAPKIAAPMTANLNEIAQRLYPPTINPLPPADDLEIRHNPANLDETGLFYPNEKAATTGFNPNHWTLL